MEKAVVKVGDHLKIWWNDGSTTEKRKAVVKEIKECKSIKNDSRFKYTVEWKDGEHETTRLLHLKWKLNTKKRTPANNDDINTTVVKKPKYESSPSTSGLPTHSRILAPMVGGSELAFRLLCRKYGVDLAYTPMMNSQRFAIDAEYRAQEFQSTPLDRPLVAHFSANNPAELLASAKLVQDQCDAIDLNLGCPQRIAHAGHFGSYLLDAEDRSLVLDMVRTISQGIRIPMFVKIRLLNTLEESIELVRQLHDAGAALVAVHARYRVNLVGRSGPGARDGPAHLDQVAAIKRALPHVTVVANGNVITGKDAQDNLLSTGADGVMSAEGLLDDPALFIRINEDNEDDEDGAMTSQEIDTHKGKDKGKDKSKGKSTKCAAPSKLALALEYLDLVRLHPVPMKCLVFHVRRMLRDELTRYQLLEDCVACRSAEEVRGVVEQAAEYARRGDYAFDPLKEKRLKEAVEKRKREEGKRKAFEERMMRKAKREGRDPGYYLSVGADVPSLEELDALRLMVRALTA